MKSYTDLEQSKKLAEILPLESADMKWYFWKSDIDAPKLPTFGYSKDAAENYKSTEAVYLPCWSLAALFSILPKYELNNFGDTIQLDVNLEALATEGDETLLDLVVNMIIHLHELKML
jgi:hypothetical protein